MGSDKFKYQKGQALTTLIFFVLIASLYITAAVVVSLVNSVAVTTTEQGINDSRLAEGALEDSLVRLLRDPNYTGGTFTLNGGNVTVTVTGTTTKTVTASVRNGNYYRRFEAIVTFNQTQMTITSWKELF